MFESVKKNYVLDGLCCPNCAAEISARIKDLPKVKEVSLDAGTGMLTVKLKKGYEGDLKAAISEIAVAVDEDITVKEA